MTRPRPLRRLGLTLARLRWIRRTIDDRAGPRDLRIKPTVRFVIGLGLIALNYLLGWPTVALLGALAVALDAPLLILVVAPIVYAFSWIVLGLGVLVAGRDALRYMRALGRWWTRVFVERLIGQPPLEDPPAES